MKAGSGDVQLCSPFCTECSYGSFSEVCIIIELASCRGLSGDDVSMSVENCVQSVHSNYHCVPL